MRQAQVGALVTGIQRWLFGVARVRESTEAGAIHASRPDLFSANGPKLD